MPMMIIRFHTSQDDFLDPLSEYHLFIYIYIYIYTHSPALKSLSYSKLHNDYIDYVVGLVVRTKSIK